MSELDLHGVSERFRGMSEPDLMTVAKHYDELVEPVQALLREEFARRSLQPPLLDEEVAEFRDLVTVRRYRDLTEAFVARSVLESAGIVCFLQDENVVRTDWLWSNLIGGARLQVAESDLEAASELLSQPIPARFPVSEDADFTQPVCPQCGSLDISFNDRDRKWAAASAVALGYPFPVLLGLPALAFQQTMYRANLWKCTACGCLWQDDEAANPSAAAPVD